MAAERMTTRSPGKGCSPPPGRRHSLWDAHSNRTAKRSAHLIGAERAGCLQKRPIPHSAHSQNGHNEEGKTSSSVVVSRLSKLGPRPTLYSTLSSRKKDQGIKVGISRMMRKWFCNSVLCTSEFATREYICSYTSLRV